MKLLSSLGCSVSVDGSNVNRFWCSCTSQCCVSEMVSKKKKYVLRRDENGLSMATNDIGNDLWWCFSCARVIYRLPLRMIAATVAKGITEEIIETVLNNVHWLQMAFDLFAFGSPKVKCRWGAVGRIQIRSFQKYFVFFFSNAVRHCQHSLW